MGGAVIYAQSTRTAAYVHAEGLPRKELLEDALPEVASEEQCLGPVPAQSSEEPQLGDTEVL